MRLKKYFRLWWLSSSPCPRQHLVHIAYQRTSEQRHGLFPLFLLCAWRSKAKHWSRAKVNPNDHSCTNEQKHLFRKVFEISLDKEISKSNFELPSSMPFPSDNWRLYTRPLVYLELVTHWVPMQVCGDLWLSLWSFCGEHLPARSV